MHKSSVLFLLFLLVSLPFVSAEPFKVIGAIHYHDGFLALTHNSNNTTQLWFFEPDVGFRLLNATFLNLTFIHSTGNRVLMYQNLSDVYSAPDIQLYTYDGKLHHLGDFNGVTDCGDTLEIYWNGEFYLLFQPWDSCQMRGYDWYTVVNNTVYQILNDDRSYSTICVHSGCYVGNLQVVPHGYLVGYTNFDTDITSLRLITLSSSGIRMKNITFGNLSVGWSGACFNGTHFATLVDNWVSVAFYNETTGKFYLGIINTTGNYRLVFLDSIPASENISFSLLGSYDGKWVVRKYRYWASWNSSTGWYLKKKTLSYLLISPEGVTEVDNATNLTPVCRQNWPLLIFKGRTPVKNPLFLNTTDRKQKRPTLQWEGFQVVL
ncbi:hypothetical protein [Thermococcus sp.]